MTERIIRVARGAGSLIDLWSGEVRERRVPEETLPAETCVFKVETRRGRRNTLSEVPSSVCI